MNTALRFLAAALFVTAPQAADADTIQYRFSGILDEIPASLASEFAVGELITGTFSVKTTLNGFLYDASGLSLTIGGDYRLTGQIGALNILNDFAESFDHFHASFDGPLTGSIINGWTPVEFDLMAMLPADTFSSREAPLSVPVGLASGVLSSIDFAPNDEETLTFRVGAIEGVNSTTPVPEPSLVTSIALGAVLLVSRRRRSRP